LDVVRPTRVVALGKHAYDLLVQHVPEVRPILGWMWHFAFAVRCGRLSEWELNALTAVTGGKSGSGAEQAMHAALVSEPEQAARPVSDDSGLRRRSQRAVMRELLVRYPRQPRADHLRL
jgi:hypothetical protein